MARANLNIIARQYQLEDMKDDISLFVANCVLASDVQQRVGPGPALFQLRACAKQELERTQKLASRRECINPSRNL